MPMPENEPRPAGSGSVDALRDVTLGWFLRRSQPSWDASQEQAFQTWLAEDPRHQAAFDEWLGHWAALEALPVEAFSRVPADRLSTAALSGTRPGVLSDVVLPVRSPWRRRALRGGGVVLAAGVLGAAGLRALDAWRAHQSAPLEVAVYETARGELREVSLPDGGSMQLDTLTRLDLRYFRDRRELRLAQGQAVFDVRADPARPFEVNAGQMKVTAVGTRFAVRHTPGAADALLDVSVDSGVVRVTPGVGVQDAGAAPAERSARELSWLLAAGQRVVVDAQGRPQASRQTQADFAAWRRHRVSFVDVPLACALAEFERYAPTGLSTTDPRVAALRLSGSFDPRDGVTLRRVLPAALPLRLVPRAEGWELVMAR